MVSAAMTLHAIRHSLFVSSLSLPLLLAACGDRAGADDGTADEAGNTESGTDSSDGSEIGDTQAMTSDTDTGTTDTGTSDTGTSDTGTTDTDTGTSDTDTSDTGGCVPDEDIEVTCDHIDNDCDGVIDDVDLGNDGICDCLAIGIIGATGYAPTADFEAWLEEQGTSVTRTLILNQPGIVDDAFLAPYDILLVDRIQRSLSPAEAAAIESFVKDDGRGVITLIGYNFDNNNPAPERDRANSVLAPFGLAYAGGYLHAGPNANVTPVFDQMHPIGMGIFDVNYIGGIEPVDQGNQGTSQIFATVPQGDAGLAHETTDGGRVIVWGDEWITFDSDWQGYADVQKFWAQMIGWAKPQSFCGDPQ